MKCIHCGKEITDGAAFCRYCGKPQTPVFEEPKTEVIEIIPDTVVTAVEETPVTPQKSGVAGPLKTLLPLILAGALVVGGIIWFISSRRATVDPKQYVIVEVDTTRLSGNATAKISTNKEYLSQILSGQKLIDAAEKALKENGKDSKQIESILRNNQSRYTDPENYIQPDFVDTSLLNIGNGEEITIGFHPGSIWNDLGYTDISWEDVCSKLKIKMDEKYTYVVSGLTEGTPVLLALDNIEDYIDFKGIGESADLIFNESLPREYSVDDTYYLTLDMSDLYSAAYSVIKDNQRIGEYTYFTGFGYDGEIDYSKVIIRGVPDDDLISALEKDGMTVAKFFKEVPISGVPQYIRSIDDLSEEEIDRIAAEIGRDYRDGILSVYKAVLKPTEQQYREQNFELIFVPADYSYAVEVYNLYRNADGSLGDGYSNNRSYLGYHNNYEPALKELYPKYDLERIKAYHGEESGSEESNPVSDVAHKKVKVLVSNLNLREWASAKAPSLGHAKENQVYTILEITENEGYTWVKLKEGMYMATNEGKWTLWIDE